MGETYGYRAFRQQRSGHDLIVGIRVMNTGNACPHEFVVGVLGDRSRAARAVKFNTSRFLQAGDDFVQLILVDDLQGVPQCFQISGVNFLGNRADVVVIQIYLLVYSLVWFGDLAGQRDV